MKPPSFPLYPDKFLTSTNTWELEERGLYITLLCDEWSNGPLENNPKKLAKIAGISPKKFEKLFKIMECKFIINADGKLINYRLESIRSKQEEYRRMLSESGKLGYKIKQERSSQQ